MLASLFSVKNTKKKKKKKKKNAFINFFTRQVQSRLFKPAHTEICNIILSNWICDILSVLFQATEMKRTLHFHEMKFLIFLGEKCCSSYLLSAIHILRNCFMEAVWVVKEKWFFYLWVKCNFRNGKSCLCILREGI